MKVPTPEDPCIRNCCLDEEDICLGCFRSLDEIKAWSSLTAEEKQCVYKLTLARKDEAKRNSKLFWINGSNP